MPKKTSASTYSQVPVGEVDDGHRDIADVTTAESTLEQTNDREEGHLESNNDAVESDNLVSTNNIQKEDIHSDNDDDNNNNNNNNDSGSKPPLSSPILNCENDSNPTMTVDDAIERLGMGKFQLMVLVAAGLCFAADAMQVLMLSFLCEVLKIEWHLTNDETAFITSILFIGSIFGTLVLGPLADRKGRKPVFLMAATIISTFGFSIGFVTNYWNLMATLFMVGFGVGGLTVPFDILAEFLPANSRGKNLLIIQYFWTVGVLFVVLVAHSTLGSSDANGNWRLFVMISSIPCFVSVLVGIFFVPESARWLCTQGRCDEAMSIIRVAAKMNRKNVEIVFPDGMCLLAEENEETDFCELFGPRWKWTTLKLWGAWGTFAFGYYGTIMVITEIFDNPTEHDTMEVELSSETYNFDYGAIFVSSSAELLGTTFAISSVDKVGRIPLQVVSYAMAGICVCALCLLAYQGAKRDLLIALGFAARIFEMSGSCTTWVNTAEILTTEVRTTGHSAANAVARIGSLFSPFLIEGKSSFLKKGLVMLLVHSITVFCVSQLPETKGSHLGRVHEDENDDLLLTEEVDDDNRGEDAVDITLDQEHQIT